jgi:hypothetical protein
VNDIGNWKTPCGLLIQQMKVAFAHILFELPGTAIIWSNISPRLKWRTSPNVVKMNRTRKRVNSFARSHLLRCKCYILKHPDFDDILPSLFDDGIHLLFFGNGIFINSIQGALETYPIVELLLGDPKRLAVFQNPPMRILSLNTLKV